MRRLSTAEAVAIHDAAMAMFGGLGGLRDEGVLDAALAQPFQTFGGADLYPDDVAKACRCAYGIIAGHPFSDGNKRTGAAVLGTCLRMAGIGFHPDHGELLRAILEVASGTWQCQELEDWARGVAKADWYSAEDEGLCNDHA